MQSKTPKGRIVGFEPVSEPWAEYQLDDGNILRIKIVVTKIIQPEAGQPGPDGKPIPAANPDGTPVYFVQSHNVLQVFTAKEFGEFRRGMR